jgi:hypothetical protein
MTVNGDSAGLACCVDGYLPGCMQQVIADAENISTTVDGD